MRNFVNFNMSSDKSENLHSDVLLLWKVYFVESICLSQKSTDELCIITLNNDAKFEEELTCALKNEMRNLASFDPTIKRTEELCLIILKIDAKLREKITCEE